MKKFVLCFLCFFMFFGVQCGFCYDKDDLINALNKTYKVNGEDFRLPSSIRNKAVNYIKARDISEENCNALMGVLEEAVSFANKVGTTNISEVSPEDMKKAMGLVNKAAGILDMEVKVNSTLDKVIATETDTGKIIEEVEKKEVFFKSTGAKRDIVFWCGIAFLGLLALIVLYVVLVKFVKVPYIDFICNTVLLLYIVCAMPFICFGNYIEVLDLLKPVLSSKVGEGYIDIVDVEIKGDNENINEVHSPDDGDVNEAVDNKTEDNAAKAVTDKVVDSSKDIVKEDKPEVIKYPVLGEMYAKLKIPSCNVDLSVYYGDNEKILDAGVGHFSGSHFPGQGKGILYTTHNTPDKLYGLKDVKIGDKVNVVTNFGEFSYKVTDTKVIKDTDKSKAYIEAGKELLMIYTCYPFDSQGYTDERFMVYCERSGV